MCHVKFDGSGFIGYRNFASFVVEFFFLYGQGNLYQIIISIILHCHWCWYNIFHDIISSEDSIPKYDFKLPEICDVIEKCMSYRQDTFLLHCPQ